MGSLASRLRIVFVLLFLFVLGLPPVHAVDVDGLDFRVGVGSGVLEEQAYLDNSGENFVDGVENNSENNVGSGSLESSSNFSGGTNSDFGVGLVSENNNNNNDVVGVDSFSDVGSVSGVPSVLGFSVSGDFDRSKTGVGFYRNVRVSVTGENFTGDNFLSKEGLHWSNKTRVEPITARKLGVINDPVKFFPQNTPNRPVDAYSMNNGDSGRITFVGKTQSNIDLDIIWTVTSSDRNQWINGSGFNNDGKVKGLGFTGQQYMPNAKGNSIVVLYNQANTLGLHYKIVRHGTMDEVPVLVSFISTDIDAGQGLDTDLDNITRIVPPESNLKIDNNLVYDATPGVVGLNGSADLPKGGYVGVGFVSSFNYTFFSPAPKRANEYAYSSAVRYDIFGSSLQANVDSRIIQNLSVEYKTIDGVELAETRTTNGYVGDEITSEELTFDGYTLVEKQEDYTASSYPKIVYVYKKDTKQVTPTKPNNPVTPNNPNQPNNPVTPTKPNNPNTPTKPTNPSKPPTPTTQPVRPQTTTPPSTITRVPQTYVPRTPTPYIPPRQSQHLQPQAVTKKNKNTIPRQQLKDGGGKKVVCNTWCKNTGMTPYEEKIFKEYIRAIAKQSRDDGKGKGRVNHDVANGLAYSTYKENDLQKMVNDFGKQPAVENWEEVVELLEDIYTLDKFKIDMPHLAMPIATYHKSGRSYELGKWFAGISYTNFSGAKPRDLFFQLNSRAGDEMSNNNFKDIRTNMDAFILNYNPYFRKFSLEKRIIEYYSIPNLDEVRKKLYKDTIEFMEKDTSDFNSKFVTGAKWSLGGFALGTYLFFKRRKKSRMGMWAREDMGPNTQSTFLGATYTLFGISKSKQPKVQPKPKAQQKVASKPKVKPKNPKVAAAYKGSIIELAKKDLKTTAKKKPVKKKVTSRKKVVKKSKPKFNLRMWGWR